VVRALNYRHETGGTTLPRSELAGEGYFTSACGITIYRGSAYPKEFYGNAFLGEVAGNLVHRQVLEPDGVTFKSRRGDERAEFVASTDNWFRPVNFTNAPDGTLHVCDMYRETIEHPWSISDELKAALDLESGRDRGRIYRLAPPGFVAPKTNPNLADATPAELVAALENPNAWWRDTAHRLIFERQDKACIEPLRKLLWNGNSAVARLHALWSLEGLQGLDQEDLLKGLHDTSEHVRRHAVRLSESRLDELPIVWRRIQKMVPEVEAVQIQLALSVGHSKRPEAAATLARLMNPFQPSADWITTAVLTGCNGRAFDVMVDNGKIRVDADSAASLAKLIGAEANEAAVQRLLEVLAQDEYEEYPFPGVIAALADGLRRSGNNLSNFAVTDRIKKMLGRVFTDAANTATDGEGVYRFRIDAVRLLSQGTFANARSALFTLLGAKQSTELQIEAVRALASFNNAEVPALLLKNYRSLSPAAKSEVVDVLASRADRQTALLDAIEQKVVNVGDIPQARRLLLGRAKDPAVAARALKLFEQGTAARAPVIEKYRAALAMEGDAERGLAVFRRECKTCHRLRDEGFEVGPNLATILHRTPEELLTHIIDPSREVSPNYLEYVVTLDDGRVLTGLIAEETVAAITLRRAERVQEVVLRRNIDEMAAGGKSLMPEGIEQKITVNEMADLLAFLLKR
jgi:putative heme-binding domain-containing protein